MKSLSGRVSVRDVRDNSLLWTGDTPLHHAAWLACFMVCIEVEGVHEVGVFGGLITPICPYMYMQVKSILYHSTVV